MAILGYVFRRGGLNAAGSIASILAVIPLFTSVIIWARNHAQPIAGPSAARLRQALEDVAGDVREQWLREIGARQLYDPEPVAVRWQIREPPVDDLSAVGTARCSDLGFTGTHDPGELAAWFWRLERRRLFMVAGPGMGKTTLAIMLLLELLKLTNASTGQTPIPVLFSISSFDPFTEDFDSWMARRLGEDLPILRDIADRDDRNDVLLSIVRRRHIIPILDGFDELSKRMRVAAIAKLNQALTDGELGFILTCRTNEYEATVEANSIVRSSHVIEAQLLDPKDVRAYLEVHLPAHLLSAWQSVLSSISDDSGSALSSALNTPLMLWLIYQVYVRVGRNPHELTDTKRFPGPKAVQAHLFSNLIPALIESYPPDSRLPGRPKRRWNALKAQDWLKYLAWHLNDMGTYDLAWWQLPAAIFRRELDLPFGLPLELPERTGKVLALARLASGRWLVAMFEMFWGFTLGLMTGSIIGVAVGLVTGFVVRLSIGLAAGITTGAVVALTIGATLGDTFRITTVEVPEWPAGSFDVGFSTPGGILRHSKFEFIRRNLTMGLILGLIFGIIFALLGGLKFGLTFGILAALAAMLSFSITAVIVGVFAGGRMRGVPAWPAYEFVRVALKLERRVPWRLMRFLDDAHHLGIVRQAGAMYQFRHATLQDHLAGAYNRDSQRTRRTLLGELDEDLGYSGSGVAERGISTPSQGQGAESE